MSILKTAENLPRWTSAGPDFFEVWYVRWNDPETDTVGWVRYTLFRGREYVPECGVWGIFLDLHRPERNFAFKQTLPAQAAALAADRFEFTAGDSGMTNERAWGRICDRLGREMSWDVRVVEPGPIVRHIPAALRSAPLPQTKFVGVEGWNMLTGQVVLDGEEISVERAVGHQAHFWGARQVESWVWGNCGSFREDPTFRFDAVVGYLKRGIPPMTMLFAQWEGQLFELNGLRHALLTNRTRHTVERWNVSGSRDGMRFRCEAQSNPEHAIMWRHYDPPNGAVRHVHVNFRADMAVTVSRRERGRWRQLAAFTSERTATFEVAQPARNPRVTLMVDAPGPQALTNRSSA
jgi:hypothetical protein